MKTRLWIVVLALAVGGLVLTLWLAGRVQRATLPDGTELTLDAVTFGKEHHYIGGGPVGRFQAWLAKSLRPLKLKLKTPPVATRTSDNDAVMFWFKVRSPKPGNTPYLGFCVVDDLGAGSSRQAMFPVLSLSPTDQVASVTFESFPRRQREIVVQAFSYASAPGSADESSPKFQAANRRFSRRSPWQASPLPQRAREGDLTFSLERLVTGVSFEGITNRAANPRDAATLAEFQVTERGTPSTNWQPVHLEASDAAGDRPRYYSSALRFTPGRIGVVFQDALWAQEPAWKLRVEFSRVAGFAPVELWVTSIPDVGAAVAGGGRREPLASQAMPASGSTVSLMGLFPGDQPGVSCQLRIRVVPEPRGFRPFLAVVRDPATSGERPVDSELFSSTFGNGQADYYYRLRGLGDARALRLALALTKSRFVEFTAKAEPLK